MAWSTADIPDQSRRTAVVTGANGGLGLETARELARAGAHVVMAARNLDKARAAEADIRTIIVRQERTGLHMADAVSRMSSGAAVFPTTRRSSRRSGRRPRGSASTIGCRRAVDAQSTRR